MTLVIKNIVLLSLKTRHSFRHIHPKKNNVSPTEEDFPFLYLQKIDTILIIMAYS